MLSILKRLNDEGKPLDGLIDLYRETEDTFLIIHQLCQIVLTYPVTSNEGERSFSALRRLYTWLRTTMISERLCSLGRIVWCYRLFFIQSIPQKSVICVLDPLIIINRFCGTPCWYMKLNFNDIKGAMKVKQTFSSWPYSQMNHVESFNSFTSYQYFFTIKTIYLLSKWYTDNRYVYGD